MNENRAIERAIDDLLNAEPIDATTLRRVFGEHRIRLAFDEGEKLSAEEQQKRDDEEAAKVFRATFRQIRASVADYLKDEGSKAIDPATRETYDAISQDMIEEAFDAAWDDFVE